MNNEETKEMDRAQQFLDHIQKAKSKNTFLAYRNGLNEFIAWIGKSADTVLAEHKSNRLSADMEKGKFYDYKIDEYYAYLVAQGLISVSFSVFRFVCLTVVFRN